MKRLLSSILLLASPCTVGNAADSRAAFVQRWQGERVTLRQTLYTLVYNEQGRLGTTYRNRREGLTVVTPFAGIYLQFDGRDGEADIAGADPQRLVDTIAEKYRRTRTLDIGSKQRIEPVLIVREEPGVEFRVKDVRVERDRVRLRLARAGAEGGAVAADEETSLTVRWPQALSRSFTEGPAIENLLAEVVVIAAPR